MTMAVTIRDLRIHIPTDDGVVSAVDGVSLDVAAGEILAVVGESGSGKTMTARAVLGFLPARARVSGSIRLNGKSVLDALPAQLRAMRGLDAAMVFQEPSAALNPVFPVGWQIAEGLKAHGMVDSGERRRKTLEILTSVGIPDPERRIDHYPHQFSGGQKQRIVIAMAIALRPAVIIADEPTTALDVTVQAEILDLFRYCRDELGAAIILITHNIGIVADLADRVVVMRHGRVVEDAPVRHLFAEPSHPYTKALLDAVPRLGGSSRQDAEANKTVSSQPVLKVSELEVRFGPVIGVRDVDFEIGPGETLGLVGESGSGKSTIAKTIVGLAPISGGTIQLFGVDLKNATSSQVRALRRKVGFVFQDPVSSFNQHFTIEECIAEPIRVHRVLTDSSSVHKRVLTLLDQVQLPASFAQRRPYELSGGQRQRVGLARALALNPTFVIADEPTSALDVSVQARVLELFAQLQKELGFSSLFISHDLAVVEEVADRVGVLRRGALVELGPARKILFDPSDSYTRLLIDSVPIPDPILQHKRRLERRSISEAYR